MSFRARPLAVVLLGASLASPCFAFAGTGAHSVLVRPDAARTHTPFERVSFSDLDLEHPAGARTLLQRIRSAAERVCGPSNGSRLDDGVNACVRTAIDHAVQRVDNPLVSSLHQKEAGPRA